MRRLCFVVALTATAFSGSSVWAQTIGGQNPSGPAVSPYLNLMRVGAPLGVNYYDLVRPQIQLRSDVANLQQNQAALFRGLSNGGAADSAVTTGHIAMFGNTSHYFPAQGGGVSAGGGLSGQRNLQNQLQMYSPLRSLGGMGTGTGLGGMSNTGMSPGVRGATTPR
ncbi:MAG TPA: hypothetical protein VH592_22835 [Gemmataceae bacterium]|jgi:hypothetical protein